MRAKQSGLYVAKILSATRAGRLGWKLTDSGNYVAGLVRGALRYAPGSLFVEIYDKTGDLLDKVVFLPSESDELKELIGAYTLADENTGKAMWIMEELDERHR